MMCRSVVIAGGSGFLGLSLARHLASEGRAVTILSRSAPPPGGPWTHVAWDARTLGPWTRCLEGGPALVNLAGRSVDCIKTPDHRDEILRSRVEATRILGVAAQRLTRPLAAWVQMSTAHIYGDPPEVWCDEDSALGYGLAPAVGREWEAACREAAPPGTRCVALRTSFVLGRSGGAMRKLVLLARLGLGGRVGSGRQGLSWIHQRDMDRLLARAIDDPAMSGVYVATAPQPVAQRDFMRELRRAVGMPIGLPAAGWMVRIGAPLLLRTDPELALYGRYCVSRRLREEGFVFEFPELRGALQDLFRSARPPSSAGRA
jgi:hypothetical protein